MRTRPFGKTGDRVSEPGLGTTFMARQGQDGVNSRIAQSMDQVITDFDTAAAYEKGNNERMLGIALRGRRGARRPPQRRSVRMLRNGGLIRPD